jgi:hypothetical protein
MSKFLDSLKSDLLDRRLLPLLALVAVGLLAAIGYAVLAGSGSSTPTSASAPIATPVSGIAVSAVSTTGEAGTVETTGSAKQSASPGRNPFTPLSEPKAKSSSSSPSTSSAAGTSTSSSPSTGGESSSGSSTPSSGTQSTPAAPTPKPKPKAKKQPPQAYEVNVLFGTTTAGTPALTAGLKAFDALKLQQPLPEAKNALVVFRGAMADGKSATFTLVGEAILRGEATCLPSTAQCQSIQLKEGQTEELEETPPGGTPVVYELYLLGIKKNTSSTSSEGASVRESKAGLKLLREAGLQALPGLRYSAAKRALVVTSHRAFAARAHDAASRHPAGAAHSATDAALSH